MKKKRKVKSKVLKRMAREKICYFCGTEKEITKHHIIPKELLKFAKPYNHILGETELMCDSCHKKFHKLLTPVIRFLFKLFEAWQKQQQGEKKHRVGFIWKNGKKSERR